jgi:hypothetical protein
MKQIDQKLKEKEAELKRLDDIRNEKMKVE